MVAGRLFEEVAVADRQPWRREALVADRLQGEAGHSLQAAPPQGPSAAETGGGDQAEVAQPSMTGTMGNDSGTPGRENGRGSIG